MKQLIIFLSIVLTTVMCYGQSKTFYNGGNMFLQILDKNDKVVSKIPMAQNVTVVSNSFFKSYEIFGEGEKGGVNMPMTYMSEDKAGTIRMSNSSSSGTRYYLVSDQIRQNGTIVLISLKVYDKGMTAVNIVEDLKYQKSE